MESQRLARKSSARKPLPTSAQGQQRAEQDDGVDALAALLGPVVVLEVQPQRELVERERRAAPERAAVTLTSAFLVDADLEQPQVPDDQQADDPERHVVDVPAARGDVPERAPARP